MGQRMRFSAYFPSAQELKDQLAEGKITDKAHLQWLINRRSAEPRETDP
jgi:hypothetical protein